MKLISLHLNSKNPDVNGQEIGVPVDHILQVYTEDKTTRIDCVLFGSSLRVYVKESVHEVIRLANRGATL